MGNKSGKLKYDDAVAMSGSARGGVREGLATWHREGVEVTDVYEIEGVLGSGLMGEVYKVKRRQEARGTHNAKTRAAVEEASGGKKAKDKDSKEKQIMRGMSKAVSKKIGGTKKEEKNHLAEAAAAADAPEPKLPPSPHLPKPKGILKAPSRGAPGPKEGAESDDDDVSVSSAATDVSLTSSQRKRRKQQGSRTIRFAREYACKTVSTARVKTGQLVELLNEIYVMRTLDHPYILRLYEVYQVKRKIWLITEYCSGGDLTARKMDEPRVAVVLEQVLRAATYMHRRGILQ